MVSERVAQAVHLEIQRRMEAVGVGPAPTQMPFQGNGEGEGGGDGVGGGGGIPQVYPPASTGPNSLQVGLAAYQGSGPLPGAEMQVVSGSFPAFGSEGGAGMGDFGPLPPHGGTQRGRGKGNGNGKDKGRGGGRGVADLKSLAQASAMALAADEAEAGAWRGPGPYARGARHTYGDDSDNRMGMGMGLDEMEETEAAAALAMISSSPGSAENTRSLGIAGMHTGYGKAAMEAEERGYSGKSSSSSFVVGGPAATAGSRKRKRGRPRKIDPFAESENAPGPVRKPRKNASASRTPTGGASPNGSTASGRGVAGRGKSTRGKGRGRGRGRGSTGGPIGPGGKPMPRKKLTVRGLLSEDSGQGIAPPKWYLGKADSLSYVEHQRLPRESVLMLKQWVSDNWHAPYPTEIIKKDLAHRGGLSLTRVTDWFRNERKRLWLPCVRFRQEHEGTALPFDVLSRGGKTILVAREAGAPLRPLPGMGGRTGGSAGLTGQSAYYARAMESGTGVGVSMVMNSGGYSAVMDGAGAGLGMSAPMGIGTGAGLGMSAPMGIRASAGMGMSAPMGSVAPRRAAAAVAASGLPGTTYMAGSTSGLPGTTYMAAGSTSGLPGTTYMAAGSTDAAQPSVSETGTRVLSGVHALGGM